MISLLLITILALFCQPQEAQQTRVKDVQKPPASKERNIVIKLRTGEELRGSLLKVDSESVDFTVKGLLQSVPLDEVEQINFKPVNAADTSSDVAPMTATLRPTILYKERAAYTAAARDNKIEGTVTLSIEYLANGRIGQVRVVRGLPDGLTESAIEAAKRIRFNPAVKNGVPVSVRGTIEFNFRL